jgi:hypothetical protein
VVVVIAGSGATVAVAINVWVFMARGAEVGASTRTPGTETTVSAVSAVSAGTSRIGAVSAGAAAGGGAT